MTDPRDRPMNLAPASVMDYRELARRKLPRQLFDYIDGGAYAESTMRANVNDLRGIHLRQRILRDVSEIDLGAKACVLGRAWTYAVAGGGEEGVAHVIRIIREEMKVAMALTGKQRLSDLGRDVLDR